MDLFKTKNEHPPDLRSSSVLSCKDSFSSIIYWFGLKILLDMKTPQTPLIRGDLLLSQSTTSADLPTPLIRGDLLLSQSTTSADLPTPPYQGGFSLSLISGGFNQ